MVIVIPTANDQNLKRCTDSILWCEKSPFIMVIDDGDSKIRGLWFIFKGEKPFIFSRNVNVGMKKALELNEDLVIMSDDAALHTIDGFSMLQNTPEEYGIISPGIVGDVGNDNQRNRGRKGISPEPKELCFICVLIKNYVIRKIGLMDERFVWYGYEDIDYCRRAVQAGIKLGVMDGVNVEHNGYSVFRNREDFGKLSELNKQIYLEKWGSL